MPDPEPSDIPAGPKARIEQLIDLLTRECGALTEPEKELARAAAQGEPCDVAREGDARLNSASAMGDWLGWESHRRIRGLVIRALCESREAVSLVNPRGIQLFNAHILGSLDLRSAAVPFDLWLAYCAFDDDVVATSANVASFGFQGSWLTSLRADRLQASGGLFLRYGCRIKGDIRLSGADIRGDLDLTGSVIAATEGTVLHADGIRIGGSLHLKTGFEAFGEVRALGARVAGHLVCSGGVFSNPDGNALSLDGSQFQAMYFRDGCTITGGLRILGAQVAGNIECDGATLSSPGGRALAADGLQVGGSIFLRSNFRACGAVSIAGSSIGGGLECDGARLQGGMGNALIADRASIGGGLFLQDGFHSTGEVRLMGTRIGGNLQICGARLENPEGYSLGANGLRVEGTLLLRRSKFVGTVDLTRSKLKYLNDGTGQPNSTAHEWPRQLILLDCRYESIHSVMGARHRLAWLAHNDETLRAYRGPNSPPDPSVYRWLSGVLRKQGHERDATAVMVGFGWRQCVALFWQRWQGSYGHKAVGIVKFFGSVLYGTIVGHGYAHFRPLYWLLTFWIAGLLIFSSIADTSIQPAQGIALRAWSAAKEQGWSGTPHDPGSLAGWIAADPARAADPALADTRWIASYPRFSAAVYSADAFLPLVDFHQEEAWTPRGGAFGSWAWFVRTWYLPLHIIMGWVIATLFAASFTRLARHD